MNERDAVREMLLLAAAQGKLVGLPSLIILYFGAIGTVCQFSRAAREVVLLVEVHSWTSTVSSAAQTRASNQPRLPFTFDTSSRTRES